MIDRSAARVAANPNVLFVMTDQQRFDTIAALGNPVIATPNMDRLVARGLSFTNAYSTCPVCVPSRYTIRSGCEPYRTRVFANQWWQGMHAEIEATCGPWLATAMSRLGYRTWGVGKAHTIPYNADEGFEIVLRSEEMYATTEQRANDAYASFVASKHPEYAHIEQLMGERSEMYYIPQASPLPAELNQEAWAADRACEQIQARDDRPWYGFVSFVGPHPPLAPPIPFNRMYDPDEMPAPIRGSLAVDHMDDQIPWMNYAVWAEDISDSIARVVKARYYGEITYIDWCLGRILDAVDSREDAENTIICFFADHGDHLGDHTAWQKESFFEASTRVPLLVSWPARLPRGQVRNQLACLTDLFGIATGAHEARDGIDLLGGQHREVLYGFYGQPGTRAFKVMARWGDWKYIWMANGGREQLFNLTNDPNELNLRTEELATGRALAYEQLAKVLPEAIDAKELRRFPFEPYKRLRILQHDLSRGVTGFPEHPLDALH